MLCATFSTNPLRRLHPCQGPPGARQLGSNDNPPYSRDVMTQPASAPVAASEEPPGPQWAAVSRIVVVTGMSGAGRSSALKALEDLGYEAVDNLPLSLVPSLMSHRPLSAPLAVGADVRTRDFGVSALADTLDRLAREGGARAAVVFLDCDDDQLVKRFTETRR